MWLLEQCRKESKRIAAYSYDELNEIALASEPFRSIINPDAPCFANPESMIQAIQHYCELTEQPVPETDGHLIRCIFDSLAMRYKQVFKDLQDMAPFPIEQLHIIGGGSQNELLNQFTSNALGVPVIAGPTEATAIGNVMMQAKACKMVGSIQEMRSLIRSSVQTTTFEPKGTDLWDDAYPKYLRVFREDI